MGARRVDEVVLEERADVDPLCPHCEKAISTVWQRRIQGVLGRRFLYFCPQCRKVLGVSHRKGFWMG